MEQVAADVDEGVDKIEVDCFRDVTEAEAATEESPEKRGVFGGSINETTAEEAATEEACCSLDEQFPTPSGAPSEKAEERVMMKQMLRQMEHLHAQMQGLKIDVSGLR